MSNHAKFHAMVLENLPKMSSEVRQGWIENPASLVRVLLPLGSFFTEEINGFPIVVDCDQSIKEMIAAGNYDYVSEEITAQRFPITGQGKHELIMQLVHFHRSLSSEQVLTQLDQDNLRSAKVEELLAFGAKYPEVQHRFPIIGLGSVIQLAWINGSLCLDRCPSGRGLGFVRYSDDCWSPECRFLVVRR